MRSRWMIAPCLAGCFALSVPADSSATEGAGEGATESVAAAQERSGTVKHGTTGSRLLLPLYLVDTTDVNGPTTFFAVRNESPDTTDVTVRYYTAETAYDPVTLAPAQLTQELSLGTKEVATFDVRGFVSELAIDVDNFARGYIVFDSDDGMIHGDYFQIDNGGNFASGSRLLNIETASGNNDPNDPNDLCTRFSMRFLDSALLFDSGTMFTVWLQPEVPYGGTAFSYSAFSLAGGLSLVDSSFPSGKFAFQVPASALLVGVNEEFGAIEFEFPLGAVGHVSGVLSALGRLSVGFEATCLDPA